MSSQPARPRVVVVGAGFGGMSCIQALADQPVDVLVLDRANYHLFQPLLYQVATAGLSPADIAWPIRSVLTRQPNATVQLAEVTGVDTQRCQVQIAGDAPVDYDFLVLGTGATHSYFGHDEWRQHAPGLKQIVDATAIREHILLAFERAETTEEPDERQRLMTFVVVGGGPTGVEMAGAIAELARTILADNFRHIHPADARIHLVEAGPRLLPAFPEKLSEAARQSLERLGIDVLLNQAVTKCDADGVEIGTRRIEAHTIVWGAGVVASPVARWLGAEADKAGRLKVMPDLSVPGHPEIFVIGDCASIATDGKPVPGIAPAAKQMGTYAAEVIATRVRETPPPAPFRYRHAGDLATIGRKAAVANFGKVQLTGFLAWLLWAVAHIYFLIGWRHRLVVALNWLWSYFTFERGARLITGAPPKAIAKEAARHDDRRVA